MWNGHIGEFEIYTSTDGETFDADPVATGTWDQSDAVKTVDFGRVEARALRLVALTEAAGLGPWSSAAEINVSGPDGDAALPDPPPPDEPDPPPDEEPEEPPAEPETPAPGSPGAIGEWSAVIAFPLVPVAAALLPNGNVRAFTCPYIRTVCSGCALSEAWKAVLKRACASLGTLCGSMHDALLPAGARLFFGARREQLSRQIAQ